MEYKISEKMKGIKPSAIREIFKSLTDPEVIAFAAGNPSPESFPVDFMRAVSEKIYADTPITALQYGITEGHPPLIEKINARLKAKFNIDAAGGNQTIICSGGQQGIDLTVKVLCNEGDVVICESPTFIGALNSFKANGAIPVGVQTDPEGGISVPLLEEALKTHKNAKLIYLIPTFHNPLGVTMPLHKRRAILALSEKYGVPVLEDNPYGELRFNGAELPTLKSLDQNGSVIYCSSFSKILSPAARVGFLSAPQSLISKIVVAKQVNDVHTNMYFQLVCDRFLSEYDFDGHIEKIRALYRAKCRLMLDEMDICFAGKIDYSVPDGGLFLWCTLPTGVAMDSFIPALSKQKVAVVPGNAFLIDGGAPSHSFRMNFSMPSDEQIVRGIQIIASVVGSLL